MIVNSDLKIGAVILSRYNSSRLSGKALREIEQKPVLAYIYERILQVLEASDIVLATSNEPSDDPIADYANQQNINVYRGSLDNVAERFYKAACSYDWDYAIRINGDNIYRYRHTTSFV